MSQSKSQVEVVRQGELVVVVRSVLVNYDQPISLAIEGLPDNNSLISTMPLEKWNGGKKGTLTTNLHLAWASKVLSTESGRQFLRGQRLNPCVPAELAALKPFCAELWNAGVYWAVALCPGNEDLWWGPRGGLRVVCLDFRPPFRGFSFGFAGGDWNGYSSFAGLPQVS